MNLFSRLRNRIVSGFIFIMPVLITLVILSQFWKHLLKVGSTLSRLMKIDTVFGPPGDAVVAVVFFVVVCLVAGFLVHFSFLKKFSEQVDTYLDRMIPGYSQVRTETTRKIGVGKTDDPRFETCLVKVGAFWQPAYLIESNADATQTVFVPQAPTFATGQVYIVETAHVRKLDIDSAALNARLKALGKGVLGGVARSS